MPPMAAMINKEMVNLAFETGLNQSLLTERRLFQILVATEDKKEGMAAFVEKRPGVWKGRWRTTPPRRGEQERIMATIAFIGLGNMGGGMAANLAKAGHRVLAFDLSEPALAKAVRSEEHTSELQSLMRIWYDVFCL